MTGDPKFDGISDQVREIISRSFARFDAGDTQLWLCTQCGAITPDFLLHYDWHCVQERQHLGIFE